MTDQVSTDATGAVTGANLAQVIAQVVGAMAGVTTSLNDHTHSQASDNLHEAACGREYQEAVRGR